MGTDAKHNPFTTTYDFSKGFAIGGYLDAQPMATGTAYERAAYGNYVFGAYMSAGDWPSIRAKALSRTNISSAVPEHRVLPERLRTKALEISR